MRAAAVPVMVETTGVREEVAAARAAGVDDAESLLGPREAELEGAMATTAASGAVVAAARALLATESRAEGAGGAERRLGPRAIAPARVETLVERVAAATVARAASAVAAASVASAAADGAAQRAEPRAGS